MQASKLPYSFEGLTLYQNDLDSLQKGQWLTASAIHFAIKVFIK